ncbi:hypothetical protein HYU14_01260 [Candidatus Woesearchaeota archaeon]|nr:hypothetical protein [Candidatus Woesearchaeota archaeon]
MEIKPTEVKRFFSKKRVLFIILFAALAFAAKKINFSALVGEPNQFFTLFQFFGPIAGSFLGPIVGGVSVLLTEITDFFIMGKAYSFVNLLRLLPMVFAAYYFGMKKKNAIGAVVPLVAIAAFVLHPVGREVWFFSLFWTIPLIVRILPDRVANNAVFKSLGATFTAHAVGGAAWVWAVPMTPEQWVALIPVVIYERLMFTGGIVASYLVMNTLLDRLAAKFRWGMPELHINPDWVISRKLFWQH